MTRTFRYVRLERVPDWLRAGWIARPALDGTHHGEYSALLEWLCDCPMAVPRSISPSSSNLLAQLRGKMRPMRIPKLSGGQRHCCMELMAWRYRRQLPDDCVPHAKALDLPAQVKPAKAPRKVKAKSQLVIESHPNLFDNSNP